MNRRISGYIRTNGRLNWIENAPDGAMDRINCERIVLLSQLMKLIHTLRILCLFLGVVPLPKFRAGVAALRLETGRFENLAVFQRTCFKCSDLVESEKHVLLSCPLYDDLQQEMYYAISQYKPNFRMLNDYEKIAYKFSSNNVIKAVAKTCKDILVRRRCFLYK